MNINLQELLFKWYYTYFAPKPKDVFKSTFSYLLFFIFQFFATIILCVIVGILWVLTPIIHLMNIVFLVTRKIFQLNSKGKIHDEHNLNTKLKIVLDLDNTLIYSSTKKLDKLTNGLKINDKFYVYKRPYLDLFLQTLSEFCELALYTSATQDYADTILNFIDKKNLIHKKFYRHDCVFSKNKYFKDVMRFDQNNEKLLIIDDDPRCYLNMQNNIIKIKFWNGDEEDDSLLKIKNIIKNFCNSGRNSIREIISTSWMSEV